MAAADTARLIATLELDPRKFNQGVRSSLSGLGRLEGRLGNIGAHAQRGVRNAAGNLAKLGAVATGVLAVGIKGGIDSLAELEDATTAVDGAIAQTGRTGQVTAKQIAGWANEIESSVQAAFDDKEITASAATLLRYGKIVPANLRKALEVETDLAAKTGDIGSASTLLARALADPTKAQARLTRQGITFTKSQQKQIETLVKAGKVGKAQALVLELIEKRTKGAAAASKGEFGDMRNTLQDTVEDAERLLAVGAMPVLKKLGGRITEALGNKDTMDAIKGIGQGAADVLDKAIEFGSRIPWDAVKTSFAAMGTGAKFLLDAFTGMPAWVQTAVISGWGLNKLTGGALGDIVGEIGKGVIKGVLGMTAGVVNIKAGVVNGGGVGGGGAVPSAGGGTSRLTKALAGASIIADIVGVIATQQAVSGESSAHAADVKGALDVNIKNMNPADLQTALNGVNQGISELQSNPLLTLVQGDALTTLQQMRDDIQSQQNAISQTPEEQAKAAIAFRESEHAAEISSAALKSTTDTGLSGVETATRTGLAGTNTNVRGTTGAVVTAQGAITAAIAANRPIVSTSVAVSVTSSGVERSTTTSTRYGEQNGSAGRSINNDHGKG